MSLIRLLEEFRRALRIPVRQPVFAVTVALVIALGVGANAAVFSLVYSMLWAKLPFVASDTLVILTESSCDLDTGLVSPNAYLEWRDRNTDFSKIAAFMWWEGGPVPAGSGTRRQLTVSVSRDYFACWGSSR
jgi:putative ABC transport system permease protein